MPKAAERAVQSSWRRLLGMLVMKWLLDLLGSTAYIFYSANWWNGHRGEETAWNVTDIRKSCHICKKTKKRSLVIEGEAVGRDQQGLSESKKSPKRLKKKRVEGWVCMSACRRPWVQVPSITETSCIPIILALEMKAGRSEVSKVSLDYVESLRAAWATWDVMESGERNRFNWLDFERVSIPTLR